MNTIVRTYAEAVEVCVNWWIEKTFKTPLNQNNGDNSPQGGMVFMLMNMLASNSQKEVTPEKIEAFKTKLTELLMAVEENGNYYTELSVDYHPNDMLYEACEFAKVDTACLPVKTFTRINKSNEIEGRYQYGGAWFKL